MSVIEDKVDRIITKELKDVRQSVQDVRQSVQDVIKHQEEKNEALTKEIQLVYYINSFTLIIDTGQVTINNFVNLITQFSHHHESCKHA